MHSRHGGVNEAMRDALARVAPGTPLRDGIDRVVRGVGRFAPAPLAGADDAVRDRRVEVWVSDAPVQQPAAFRCVSGSGQVALVGGGASAP